MVNKVYTATDIGLMRARNEDVCAALAHHTYIIADGMGGHLGGDLAARLVVDTVREFLAPMTAGLTVADLSDALSRANRRILDETLRQPMYRGMGTTATVVHLDLAGRAAHWAHVGDSRLYLYRQGSLRQITRDHSLVSDLLARGKITAEQAREHPKKHYITRAVGFEPVLDVDTGSFAVNADDLLLLCTDGLTAVADDADLARVIAANLGGDVARALVSCAANRGSRDNITALAVRLQEQPSPVANTLNVNLHTVKEH